MAAVDQAVTVLAPVVGTAVACRALGWPRSSWEDVPFAVELGWRP